MAKDVIFQEKPPVSKISRVVPSLPSGNVLKRVKRFQWFIDLSQHTRLKVGDKLQKGDEWFNDLEDKWEQTMNVDCLVGTVQIYRRRRK